MKKADYIFATAIVLFFLPFFVFQSVFDFYIHFNADHGMIVSFIKFAILATLGEVIGLRIGTGSYFKRGFGLWPRAIVWGFLGLTIKMAFIVFAVGTPAFMVYLGMENAPLIMKKAFSLDKVLLAFCISATMNLIYAPVMMTLHKITDMHIMSTGGTLAGFLKPISFKKHFVNLNWSAQWNFVFKKTIPIFWIPMHTITFLLPPDFQVLFAAILGIALGTILAIAGMKN
jgi:hypothetical protein